MIKLNFLILMISSAVPLILAIIWYNPRMYARILNNSESTPMNIKWNFGWLCGLYVLSLMYSISMSYQVIHQLHFQSMLLNEVGFDRQEGNAFKDLLYILELYGKNFRSFGHGAFHGFLNSIFLILPILVFQKLTANLPWRITIYHWAFWASCSIIMGGIICELY